MLLLVLVVALLARFIAAILLGEMPPVHRIEWPQFVEELKDGEIRRVIADGREYRGRYLHGGAHERFVTRGPTLGSEPGLRDLKEKHSTLVAEDQ